MKPKAVLKVEYLTRILLSNEFVLPSGAVGLSSGGRDANDY